MGAMQQPDEHKPTMSSVEKELAPLETEGPFANENDPAQMMPAEVLNGENSPPQQVYVDAPAGAGIPNGVTGIESQLMGLSMDPETEPGENGDTGEDNNDEDEEPEVEPVKLFVGQVRNTMNSK
jgi:hypothetical protein